MSNDITKSELYESVKTLVESDSSHVHLPQHKLFTLYSIAFQYLLFLSTKQAGAYIIRIEDSALADKLARKAKDPSSRKFLQSLMLPRKLKYGKSTFFLDFFHVGSWALTKDIPKEKIKAALIVKNTSSRPMTEVMEEEDPDTPSENSMVGLPEDIYITSLLEFVPRTITVAYEADYEGVSQVTFPFIKRDRDSVSGLTISKDIDMDDIDS